MTTSTQISRVKKAELLSSIGAGVLGAGIVLLLANQLASYVIPIILLGLLSHAAGMFQKHGLERQGEVVRVWWVEALYCLAGLGSAVTLRHRPPIFKRKERMSHKLPTIFLQIDLQTPYALGRFSGVCG